MNHTKKKFEEKKHISNLLDIIRYELGNFSINEERESPDFSVTLFDGSCIAIEETQCCPSANKKGSRKIKSYTHLEKVREEFFYNAYLTNISERNKINLIIYNNPKENVCKHTIKEFCDEIEKHLRYVIEPTTSPKPSERLIKSIRVNYIDTDHNIININHIARRDAIKAKELIMSIKNKEQKRKDYIFNGPIWLCVFLPFPENRHPYEIKYDEECTKEEFEQFIQECGYERIYITSEFKSIDIMRVK